VLTEALLLVLAEARTLVLRHGRLSPAASAAHLDATLVVRRRGPKVAWHVAVQHANLLVERRTSAPNNCWVSFRSPATLEE
jgi:hypothetical protein